MALAKFSKSHQCCGTCDFWTGSRRLDNPWAPANLIIEGRGFEEVGKCMNRHSGRFNMDLKANQPTCGKWELVAMWRR